MIESGGWCAGGETSIVPTGLTLFPLLWLRPFLFFGNTRLNLLCFSGVPSPSEPVPNPEN